MPPVELIMMPYKATYTKSFLRDLKKLERPIQLMLIKYIKKNIDNTTEPRIKGRALVGNQGEYWRYIVGDYRIIVQIQDSELLVLAIKVGHRKHVYRR